MATPLREWIVRVLLSYLPVESAARCAEMCLYVDGGGGGGGCGPLHCRREISFVLNKKKYATHI